LISLSGTPALRSYRKAKAPEGVESTSIPCPVQRLE
jgi:hypothetical protein